jgi:hypothetical protein
MFKDYRVARAEAQKRANEFGYDYGLEKNKLFNTYTVFILPRMENRCGHELRCEVISAEDIKVQRPGHGLRG